MRTYPILIAFLVTRATRVLYQFRLAFTLVVLFVPAAAFAQVSFAGTQFPIGDPNLLSPGGIAVDHLGNLYIADSGNNRILELPISTNGFAAPITLLSNLSKPTGIVVDWSGNLYIADSGNNRILKLAVASGGFAPPATIATGLNAPGGIALDTSGNLFIADTGNNRVIEFPALASSYGAPIVLGSGFSAPGGVAVDASRNLYVADTGNNRIVKMTVASAYTAQQALYINLSAPAGIFVDAAYDLFISSEGGHKVIKEPWAAGAGRFNSPVILGNGWTSPVGAVSDTSGNVFVLDAAATQVWELPAATQSFPAISVGAGSDWQIYNFSVAAGTTIGSAAVLTQGVSGLDFTQGNNTSCTPQTYAVASICSVQVQFNPTGSGLRTGAVVLYDSQGNSLVTTYLSGTGIGSGTAFLPAAQIALGTQLSDPSGIAVDGAANIYVADTGNNRIVEFPLIDGAYGSEIVLPVTQLNAPMGLAVDGAGSLFIASSGNDKIVKLPRTSTGFGSQVKLPIAAYVPTALNFDRNGTLYVADTYENSVYKIVWNGNSYATPQVVGSYIKMPMGIAADTAGNLFFSMPYQNNLVEVPYVSGKYQPQRYLATQQVAYPTSVVTDGNSNIYLLDSGNNRVVMYPARSSGLSTQIPVATGFNAPTGMAIDGNNNLYVADSGNNRIVILQLAQAAPIHFLSTYVGITSSDGARHATVQNVGNVPTTITALTYPGDFPEDSATANSCIPGMTLTPSTGCPLAMDFSPQTTGALSETASVAVSNSASEQTTSVSLSGTALSRQSQTITFAPVANLTYGSPAIRLQASSSSGLPVAFQVLSGPATLAADGVYLNITGAGIVVVAASQSGNTIYQTASPVTISFSIAPATLTITPANATAAYGAIPSSFSYSITGFVLGQWAGQVVSGAPVITVPDGPAAGAGTHAIVASLGTLRATNYVFAFAPGTLTVQPAVLQIAAQSASMIYGAALPKFTWTAKGFVNGDTITVLQGSPEFGTPASSRAAVGPYAITPTAGTLKAANYTFTFTSGTLTITAAALTVTVNSQSMVYGSALPQMSYSITGFLNSDTANALSGAPAFSTTASQHAPTGIYSISPSTGTLTAANYTFIFVNGSMTVVPAPLTVTPATVTLTYGQSIPAIKNLQLSGLVNGDTAATALTGAPILSTSATAGTAPGTTVITIQKGTLAAANYTIQLLPGQLIINPAVLNITPASASRVYGSPNPAFSYAITGFVNGDTASQLSGSPAVTTSATTSSPAGNYIITASAGTLNSANYTFASGSATLTITKASLTLIVNPLAITYGTPTPVFTYAITGLLNGDAASVITGTPALTTTAGSAPAVGSYPISINVSGLSAANYSFTGAAGTLTVNKAAATITANNQSVTIGSSLPSLTYTVSGLVNNDQATAALTGAPSLTTTAAKGSPVGTYPITIATGTVAAKNYNLTLVNGTLTITQPASTGINPQPITPRLPNKTLP